MHAGLSITLLVHKIAEWAGIDRSRYCSVWRFVDTVQQYGILSEPAQSSELKLSASYLNVFRLTVPTDLHAVKRRTADFDDLLFLSWELKIK